MKTRAEEEVELRRYLLRELTPDDDQRIEARLFLERAYREQLEVAEDELIDEYLNDDLPPGERERFETHFLADPLRAEDLRIARALHEYISPVPAPAPPLEKPADPGRSAPSTWKKLLAFLSGGINGKPLLAAAAILVALGVAWFAATRILGSRQVPAPAARQSESPQERRGSGGPERAGGVQPHGPEQGSGQQDHNRVSPSPPGSNNGREQAVNEKGARQQQQRQARTPEATAFFLSPVGIIREAGAGASREAPTSGERVLLRLVLLGDANHKSYRAALLTENEEFVYGWGPLKTTPSKLGKVVPVPVPAGLLRPEKYQMKLTADLPDGTTKTVGTYHFSVLNP